MGYLYLVIAKVITVIKMIAMKSCGSIAKGLRNSIRINIIRTLICVAVSILVCAVSGFFPCSAVCYIFSAAAGIGIGVQLICWVLAVQEASVCLVEVSGMVGSVVLPMCLAPLIFKGETVSLFGWIGALLLFAAVFLFSPIGVKKKESSGQQGIKSKAPLYLILQSAGGSASVIFQKLYAAADGEATYFNLISFIVTLLFLLLVSVFFKVKEKNNTDKENAFGSFDKRVIALIIVASVCLYGCQYFMTLASAGLIAGILYPLSPALNMTFSYLCDTVLYKEKVTARNLAGMVIVIAAILCVCM